MLTTLGIAGIDLPTSAQDFLKPEFNGKVITCYPNDDDVTLYLSIRLFRNTVEVHGQIYGANPQWFADTWESLVPWPAAKRSDLDTMTNVSLGIKTTTSQPTVAFSNVDPLPIWPQTTGDLQRRPHPNAAKTLHHLVPGEGTAKPNRHLVDALGCASTVRSPSRY